MARTRGLRGKVGRRGVLAISGGGGGHVRLFVSNDYYYHHHHAINVHRVLWLLIICICLVVTTSREILRAGTGTASVHLGGHSMLSDCRSSISRITSGKTGRGLGRREREREGGDRPEPRSWGPWLGPVRAMSGCIL